ncbi:MAG: hypothetical protein EZS28_016236 [Streblomastix strix]|uniref:Uncharacterized protein n=1 Tax=Streblomastix strix TaxID=222440 RepID=A0A5J4W130_9EUKA|nr:MAG: hypothetical protein EZS28_016236 [Streblomastix strix]
MASLVKNACQTTMKFHKVLLHLDYMDFLKKRQGVDSFIVLALDDNDRFFITTDPISYYSLCGVLVIFNLDEKCTDVGTCPTEQDYAQSTSQTPISQCPCLTTSDPRDVCNYPVSEGDEDSNWLPPSLLISPLY